MGPSQKPLILGDHHSDIYPMPRFIHIGRSDAQTEWHYPQHRHDCYEWLLIEQGRKRAWINGDAIELEPGDCYLVQPGQMHEEEGLAFPLSFRYLRFSVTDDNGRIAWMLPPPGDGQQQVLRGLAERYAPYYDQIEREIREDQPGCTQVADAIIHQLVWLWRREFGLSSDARAVVDRREGRIVAKARSWMLQHLEQGADLAAVAVYCGVSEETLDEIFMRQTGLTPAQHFDTVRVERAKGLLMDGEWSLDEVAESVGFDDEEQLARRFKRLVGEDPVAFRAQHNPPAVKTRRNY